MYPAHFYAEAGSVDDIVDWEPQDEDARSPFKSVSFNLHPEIIDEKTSESFEGTGNAMISMRDLAYAINARAHLQHMRLFLLDLWEGFVVASLICCLTLALIWWYFGELEVETGYFASNSNRNIRSWTIRHFRVGRFHFHRTTRARQVANVWIGCRWLQCDTVSAVGSRDPNIMAQQPACRTLVACHFTSFVVLRNP